MLVYVILVMVFITVGQLRGNVGLTQSMKDIATSPNGFVSTVRSVQTPLRSLVVSAAADAVYPLLSDMNKTIASTVDIRQVASDTHCIINGVKTSLPDPAVLLNFLASANGTLVTVKNTASSLQADLGSLTNTLVSTKPLTGYLRGNLTDLYSTTRALNASVSAANADMTTMDGYLSAFKNTTSGLPSVAADLTNATTKLPSQATATAAATGNPSLQGLLAHSMDDNAGATNRANLLTQLQSINTNLNFVGDLSVTADNLAALNTRINNLRSTRLLDSLIGELDSIQAALSSVPSTATLNASIVSIQNAINSVSLAPVRAAIVTFNTTLLTGMPNVTVVQVELGKIDGIGNIITCMGGVITQITKLNDTIVRLPSAFSSVTDMLGTVNSTYQSSRSQIATFQNSLGNLTNFAGSMPNITQYLSLVDSLQAQINNPPVNFSSVQTSLVAADAARSAFNISSMRASLVQVNTSVWDSNLVASTQNLNDLRSLNTVVAGLKTTVGTAATDLNTYSTTYRCRNTNTACTAVTGTSAPCSAINDCVAGIPRCTLSWATTCNNPSDCTGGGLGTCPFQQTDWTNAMNALVAYVAAGPDATLAGLGGLKTALNSASSTVAGTPSVSGFSSSITSFQSSLGAIPINSSLTALGSLEGYLDPSSLNLGSINSSINTALSAVGAVDLSSIKTQLTTFNDSISSVRASTSGTLDTVDRMINSVETFFYVTLPANLPLLTRASLASQTDLGGVVSQVAGVAQAFVGFVNDVMNSTMVSFNISKLVADNMKYVDVITDPSYAKAGSIYFITKLPMLNMDTVPPSEAGTTGTVWNDAAGTRWSGSRLCVTDSCIVNTIDDLNKKPLNLAKTLGSSSNSGSGGGGVPNISIPLSREQIFFLPFLIPLLIALLGCCGAVGLCGKRWQRIPTCCSGFWICCTLPWIFIFAGALFFPIVMGAADGCRGAFNVGYTYLAGSEQSICSSLPSATWTPSGCRFSVQDQNFTVALPQVYGALFGTCADFPNALSGVYSQVQHAMTNVPGAFVNSTIDGFNGGEIQPRPAITNIAKSFGVNVGATMGTFVGDLGNTFSCETLNSDITRLTGSVCCSTLNSLYWFVSAWFLIAFFMCCCGFPASIFGYKRFPNALWGPDYEARLKAASSPAAVDDAMLRAGDLPSSTTAGGANPVALGPSPTDGVAGKRRESLAGATSPGATVVTLVQPRLLPTSPTATETGVELPPLASATHSATAHVGSSDPDSASGRGSVASPAHVSPYGMGASPQSQAMASQQQAMAAEHARRASMGGAGQFSPQSVGPGGPMFFPGGDPRRMSLGGPGPYMGPPYPGGMPPHHMGGQLPPPMGPGAGPWSSGPSPVGGFGPGGHVPRPSMGFGPQGMPPQPQHVGPVAYSVPLAAGDIPQP